MQIRQIQTILALRKINFNSLRSLIIPLINYSNALEYHVVSHGDRYIKSAIRFHLLCIMIQVINVAILTHIDLDEVLTDYIKETDKDAMP
jgi:hypothetical protein